MMRSIKYVAVVAAFAVGFYSCNTTGIPEVYHFEALIKPDAAGNVNPAGGEFEAGEEIEILAEPSEEYVFVRWEGDIEGDKNPITVTVDRDMEVAAVFKLKEYSLRVDTEGEGSVLERVLEEKSKDYEHGTVVELTAEPEDDWKFVGWAGDLSGSENPSTITIEEEKQVSAIFEQREYPLNIEIEGKGKVDEKVTEKAKDYEYGTTVQLTAKPDKDWRFERWEGDLSGNSNTETIVVDGEKNVTAIFQHMIISHGYVAGVTPGDESDFKERSYRTVQADWNGPGGDKRWLGKNLGATDEPKSIDDDNPDRSGWYFQFNRGQGYYHDGSFSRADGFPTGPASRSTIREDSDWQDENDPCSKLFGDNWRIPTEAEWQAAAEAGSTDLNLHYAGQLSASFGHPMGSRGEKGVYWSSTQLNSHNGIFFEAGSDGSVASSDAILKHYGLPVRCIED